MLNIWIKIIDSKFSVAPTYQLYGKHLKSYDTIYMGSYDEDKLETSGISLQLTQGDICNLMKPDIISINHSFRFEALLAQSMILAQ